MEYVNTAVIVIPAAMSVGWVIWQGVGYARQIFKRIKGKH